MARARRQRHLGRRRFALGLVLAASGSSLGCIIPDAGIGAVEEFDNPGAVRIVEPAPITPEADDACGDLPDFNFCPALPDTLPSGELVGNGPLCRCPMQQRDDNAPNGFQIYAEDPDVIEVEGVNRPVDDLFGAFLLDVPAGATDLSAYQAYTNALSPDEPAQEAVLEVRATQRDGPFLRAFQVGGFTGDVFDVCNDNDGAQLDPGLHELRFIVTDRPWFAPIDPTMEDEQGNPLRGDPLIGVPDLPAGATYDTTTFVFRCIDEASPDGGACACFDLEEN